MAIDVRRLAVEAFTRVQQESSYSSAVLDSILNKYGDEIPQPDQALLSRLYYGVLERLLTLDYIIETHSKIKLKKMHPVVVQILRLGCYQLIFMDKIPAPAAV
ncbi:MAG TPA: transcription antitermination factor NusB, partial [Candidatus Avimonas sp.]|nr:transcription antitermination factor NusB [Candidatus Avimonas sp.]